MVSHLCVFFCEHQDSHFEQKIYRKPDTYMLPYCVCECAWWDHSALEIFYCIYHIHNFPVNSLVNHHPVHSHCSQPTLCHTSVDHPNEGPCWPTPLAHHYTVPSCDNRIQIQSLCHYKKWYPINVELSHGLTAPECTQLAYFTTLHVAGVRGPNMGKGKKQICLEQCSLSF